MTGLLNFVQAVRSRLDADRLLDVGHGPFAVV